MESVENLFSTFISVEIKLCISLVDPMICKRRQIESRWKDNLGLFVTSVCPGVSVGVFKVFQQRTSCKILGIIFSL